MSLPTQLRPVQVPAAGRLAPRPSVAPVAPIWRPRQNLHVAPLCATTTHTTFTTEGTHETPLTILEGRADDPTLANPLERLKRLGTGWMGVILEFEGVVVQETAEAHTAAWCALAEEEGRPAPMQWQLRRSEGMKADQVISEVLCLAREPSAVRRLAARKEELYAEFCGDRKPAAMHGVQTFLETLQKHDVPIALATSDSEKLVLPALEAAGLSSYFDVVVCGEDIYRGRPDPEPYMFAAQQLQRPLERCVVVGNSNLSVEAAREVSMQVIAVAGRQPLYELTAADMVVRDLEEISFVNLKQLFRNEEGVEPQVEEELDEEDEPLPQTAVGVMEETEFDPFWP